MADRIGKIVRCMDEINRCLKDEKSGEFGAFLGEMDWLEELHYLIHEEE
jgi:hypothetical protein